MVTRRVLLLGAILLTTGCADVLGIEARNFAPCETTRECRAREGPGSFCDAGACTNVPAAADSCVLLEPADTPTSVAEHDWDPGEPVVLGVLYRLENEGEVARLLAMRLAVREINENLGLGFQRRLVMVACDYGGGDGLLDGTAAREAIESGVDYLADDLGASAIIAGSSSASTQVAINHIVLRDLPVAYVSSFSTSTQLTDYADNGLLWRTAATDAGQAVALAELIAGTAGLGHVAIVYVDDTYGRPLQQSVNVELGNLGSSVTTSLHSFESSETSFESVVDDALAESPDGMLVIGIDGATVISVYEALVATGNHGSIAHHFLADAAKDQTALLSDDLEPAVRDIVAGALGTAPYHSTGAQYETFKRALADAFEIDADGFSFLAQSYDAAYLGGYGLAYAEAADSPDGTTVASGFARTVEGTTILVGKPDWNQARSILTTGDDADRTIDIDGTSGPLDFDVTTGDTSGPMEIWRPTADFSSFETCAVCGAESCDLSGCQ
jgi:branched-chain amino acid transport system substrate-binding protein